MLIRCSFIAKRLDSFSKKASFSNRHSSYRHKRANYLNGKSGLTSDFSHCPSVN